MGENQKVKVGGLLQSGLFLLFFLISVRFVYAYLNFVSNQLLVVGLVSILLAGIFVWFNTRFVLLAMMAIVPLITGIQNLDILKLAPVTEFAFAVLYIFWYAKFLKFKKDRVSKYSDIEFLVDIFAWIIILSLFTSLIIYPYDFLMTRLLQPNVTGISSPFWSINGAYIMLSGLIYFRLLIIEFAGDPYFYKKVLIVFYVQSVIILLFSGYDFFSQGGFENINNIKISLPFGNIHALGNYTCLLLFFHLTHLKITQGSFKNFYSKIAIYTFPIVLFLLLVFSNSRSSWLSFILVSGVILFINLSWEKRYWFVSFCVGILIIINVFGYKLFNSHNRQIKRFARLTVIESLINDPTVLGRLMRWKIAVEMIQDYPVTGCGIGSYFRLSSSYISPEELQYIKEINSGWRLNENVHNYYLQIAAELGIPGIIILGCVFWLIYKNGVYRFEEKTEEQKIFVKGLLIGQAVFLITLIADHSLLLSSHQIMFWFFAAAVVISGRKSFVFFNEKRRRIYIISALIFLIILGGGYYNKIKAELSCNQEYGYYKQENISGEFMRWTMKHSCTTTLAQNDYFGFSFFAEPEKTKAGIIKAEIVVNGTVVDKIVWEKKAIRHKYYHIPSISGNLLQIKINVNTSYNLYKQGITDNIRKSRNQSLAVTEVKFFKIPIQEELTGCILQTQ